MKTLARARDREEILRRLKLLRPNYPAKWGRMSAHQMVCHLSDAFRMAIGEQAVSHDITLARQTIVKWIALYAPLPWPSGIVTRPEIDQVAGMGRRPGDFGADIADVEAMVQRFIVESERIDWPPHPYFGRMSTAAWLRWGYLHTDHHLRQFGA